MLKFGFLLGLPSAVAMVSVTPGYIQDSDFIFMMSIAALLIAIIPRLDTAA